MSVWTDCIILCSRPDACYAHRNHNSPGDHTWNVPKHRGMGSLVHHDMENISHSKGAKDPQEALAPSSKAHHCNLSATSHQRFAIAARPCSCDTCKDSSDTHNTEAHWSCSLSEATSGLLAVAEDQLLEKAIDEWQQLCHKMQHCCCRPACVASP